MTMKFTQLRTYWNADDAQLILGFLDELRDALCNTYGTEIIKQQQKNQEDTKQHSQQLLLDIDEADDF